MGKISILTKKQKIILDEFAGDSYLASNFYLTGGTALSEFYFQHRISDDLDFFSEKKFDTDLVSGKVRNWSEKYDFRYISRYVEPSNIFLLTFSDKEKLKVDFTYYSYNCLKVFEKLKGINVDSKFDIAVNKLVSVTQRIEVKDFVDLYFLLQEFSFWDLKAGAEKKFKIDIQPILIAADFLAVEEFVFLPNMVKPLKIELLKKFFRELSKRIGKEGVA